jgi:hypothetical protein
MEKDMPAFNFDARAVRDAVLKEKDMTGNKRRHLSRDETIRLHALMKDYVELGDKINGVQYASYKAPGMHDIRMAEIAQERLGFPVTPIQIRSMRVTMFGKVFRQKPERQEKPQGSVTAAVGGQSHFNGAILAHIGAIKRALDQLQQRQDALEERVNSAVINAGIKREAFIAEVNNRLDNLEQDHTKTRNVLWTKYNALLYHVKQLDTEWSSCRPPGYQPGLPEIVNDTNGDKS